MDDFKQIMEEICEELGINLKVISKDWIYVLEKNGIIKFTTKTSFDNNTHALGNIFDDKYGTYELLKELKVPVISHAIVYDESNESGFALGCNTREYVYDFFEENNHNIVLKANSGFGGKEVYHITSKNEIDGCLSSLFKKSYSISMCPFYHIKNEYRLFVLDGNIELIYKKIKPTIIGDGHSTIFELLRKLNPHYFIDNNDKLNVILAKDEIYEYNWQFNLSGGAVLSLEIDDKIRKDLVNIANQITSKIDVGFATIDIVELESGEKLVMEINSGVGMAHFRQLVENGREISKNLYKKAVMKMFNL